MRTRPTSESSTESSSDMCPKKEMKTYYKVVVMGAAKVGKTSLIHRFLYNTFPSKYCPTVEELYRKKYLVDGSDLILDILDTSGTFEFPAMRHLAISTADFFILVYSINDAESFEEVRRIRDLILEIRPFGVPIVIVGNKSDLEEQRVILKEVADSVVNLDWENGFAEVSAKNKSAVSDIFTKLSEQAHFPCDLSFVNQNRRHSEPIFHEKKSSTKRNSCVIS